MLAWTRVVIAPHAIIDVRRHVHEVPEPGTSFSSVSERGLRLLRRRR